MTKLVNPALPGSVIAQVGVSSTGSINSYALADHVHAGMVQIAAGGNTAGDAINLTKGVLALYAGNNLTLSASSSAGLMTLKINAAQNPITTSSWYMGPPLADFYTNASDLNTISVSFSNVIQFIPFSMSAQMTASTFDSIFFGNNPRAVATSVLPVTRGHTFSFALYSVDTANSAYNMVASNSFSGSFSFTSSSQYSSFDYIRTTSIAMNTSVVLTSGITYALAVAGQTGAGDTSPTIGLVRASIYKDITYDPSQWGVTSSSAASLLLNAPAGTIASSTAFPATVSFSNVGSSATLSPMYPMVLK